LSAPRDKWIVHISMPLLEATSSSAEELLRPYLDATLSLTAPASQDGAPSTLFTLFYIQQQPPASTETSAATNDASTALVVPPRSPLFPEVGDSAATLAESMFWEAVETLKTLGVRPRPQGGDGVDSAEVEVDSFWPPLDSVADDTGDEW